MSTLPRFKTRCSIDWGQSKLKKGGGDRSVIRLYTERSYFSHFTTISSFPSITTTSELSRSFPHVSELFRAIPSHYEPSTISLAIHARAARRNPIHVTLCHTGLAPWTLRARAYPSIRYWSHPSRTPVSHSYLFHVKFLPSSIPQPSLFSYIISHRHLNAPF